MKLDRFIRIAIAFVVVAAFVVIVGGLLFVTESALDLRDRLQEGPVAFLYFYAFAMAVLVAAVCWLIYKLVVRRKPKAPPVGECESPPTQNMPGCRWPFSAKRTWQMPSMS